MQPYPQPQQPAHAPAPYTPAQPPALPPGTILLDRYLIQGYIGGGGFGHIYKAFDNALGYRRAIKEAFFHDPLTRQQFHLEAEFLFNTRHPNLVGAYAIFEQAGRLYLVMDYVDGHTLEEVAIDHIRRTGWPLPERRILDWMIPVCGALHALHSSPVPIIHRDVKPANVKINRQGRPILIDLGLAKLNARGTKTIGAALAFTPGYAPPEQYRASGATDARTDVYGMGATLFYLLTGYQPTEAPARLGSLAVPPLRQLNPAIGALTEAAVVRAMDLLPEQRQQSALELEHDLRAARAALGAEPAAASKQWSVPAGVMCLACGTTCPPGARHCMRCGARLVGGSAGSVQAPTASPADVLVATDVHVRRPELVETPESLPEAGAAVPAAEQGAASASAGRVGGSGAGDVALGSVSASGPANEQSPGPQVEVPASVAGGEPEPGESRLSIHTAPLDQQTGTQRDDGGDGQEAVSLLPGPDSKPDQPAIVMPPLRRGPAPAAMPLHPADPIGVDGPSAPHQATDSGPAAHAEPLWHPGARPVPSRESGARLVAPARGHQPQPERAVRAVAPAPTGAVGGAVGLRLLALRQQFIPSLSRWYVETVAASAPQDESEVRMGLAGMIALVLAVVTLASVRFWPALPFAVPALFLGHWCLDAETPRSVPEARWLAKLALVITYTWLVLYVVGNLFVALHGRAG